MIVDGKISTNFIIDISSPEYVDIFGRIIPSNSNIFIQIRGKPEDTTQGVNRKAKLQEIEKTVLQVTLAGLNMVQHMDGEPNTCNVMLCHV